MPEEINTPQPQTVAKKSLNLKNILVGSVAGLVVVGLIGAGFYYYLGLQANNPYDTGNSTNKTATKSAVKVATKSATVSAQVDPTANWKTFTNAEVKYSVKYPQTWLLKSYLDDSTCTSDASFLASTKETLGLCSSGFGGLVGISRTSVGNNLAAVVGNYKPAYYLNYKKENTTIAGKSAVKISGISQINNEMGDQTGDKVIVYIVDLGTRTLILSYYQTKTWTDYSATFETIVTTLKFL